MELYKIAVIITIFLGVTLLMSYLDAKYKWQLTAWCNGKVSNPFLPDQTSQPSATIAEKDAKIATLEERIAVLEAIVTEPAYELRQKFKELE